MDASRPISLQTTDLHVRYYPLRRRALRRSSRADESIHAVQGISLTVHEGEVVGVIGANGSGKSSLLSALAGLVPVESGLVQAVSYPALLGVRPAIRSLLSGRDNITLGCLALGMGRDEIAEKMPSIVKFAGVDKHVDLPLRTWSSGMRARLVFAISTSVQPRILLVDEVLAVGDAEFRLRSERRLRHIASNASTVILVSHKLADVRSVTSRVIWIDKGKIRLDGEPQSVISQYESHAKALADAMEADSP